MTTARRPRVVVDLLSYTGTKGGMERYARELYREIGRQCDDLEFVGLASREGFALDHSWFPGEVVDSGISGEHRVQWAIGELWRVPRWAKRLGADLVHSPATLGPARTSMPTVVTMHDMLYWSNPELMTTPLYTRPVKWMERRASRNATRILTISNESADAIVRYLRFDRSRLHVIPLAGTPVLGPDATRAEQPERLILATGNRRPHKNWAGLIRALPLVDEAVRPKVVITGGRGEDPLQQVVDETGMGDWVELRGWVDDDELQSLYSRAAAVAMPSFVDGFCLPALEAMMAGVPVMISDIPVYREVCADAAVYFDPKDPQSIADAMTTVVSDPERMREVTAAGMERARGYSWERTARETLDVFRLTLDLPARAHARA